MIEIGTLLAAALVAAPIRNMWPFGLRLLNCKTDFNLDERYECETGDPQVN